VLIVGQGPMQKVKLTPLWNRAAGIPNADGGEQLVDTTLMDLAKSA
jgi:hypothetical protein